MTTKLPGSALDFFSIPEASSQTEDWELAWSGRRGIPTENTEIVEQEREFETQAYWTDLNPSQREATRHTEGPLMVLAGAGSGKTKMLTSRITHLVYALRVPAHQILAVTFTNKAAREMKERVERNLQSLGLFGSPEIGTFHSVCLRILRRELQATPFTSPFVIYDDADQLSLMKTVLAKLDFSSKDIHPKAFLAAINRLKCDALEPHEMEVDPSDLFQRQLKQVYEQYQKDLFANQAIDFGEILCMTYRILRDHAQIRNRYQSRFRYLHVDEYQDTNRVQYLLLQQLASREHGGHENLCVVGDEDQSIYKWRGADIRNILEFEGDYPRAHVVKLEQNYRSTKTIIEAASFLIANNRQRKGKTLWTENPEGEAIELLTVEDEREEAEWVVRRIQKMASEQGLFFKDFAIFYRTHAQSRQFEECFRRERIPYEIYGGLKFYDRKEVKDTLAYFRVILNPHDSVSLKRIINVPTRGIGKTTLEKMETWCREQELRGVPAEERSLWMAAQAVRETQKKIAGFLGLMESLQAFARKNRLTELLGEVLETTGYVKELRQEGTDEAQARIENLEELETVLQEFEATQLSEMTEDEIPRKVPLLLPLFLEEATLATDVQMVGAEGGEVPMVQMMTLHASKGLEFPVVFMVGLEEGLFPSVRMESHGGSEDEEIEEERRLCYVGMTRARKKLFLSHAKLRRIWGQFLYQEPARFLQEIPTQYLQNVSTRRTGNAPFGHPTTGVAVEMNHPDYGTGRVISQDGAGEHAKILVEFSGGDRKRFLLRFVQEYLSNR